METDTHELQGLSFASEKGMTIQECQQVQHETKSVKECHRISVTLWCSPQVHVGLYLYLQWERNTVPYFSNDSTLSYGAPRLF